MRVAVSGTHFSGKSTLIASLLKQLSNYVVVDEPYFLLEEEGYEFSDPPAVEDFEMLFKRSIRALEESGNNTLFDRCPLDCLAYALAIEEGELDMEDWIGMMEDGIQRLDLIVYVPIENRIPVPESEDMKLRLNVDEKLREILLDDLLGILEDVKVIEAVGSLEKRVRAVLAQL